MLLQTASRDKEKHFSLLHSFWLLLLKVMKTLKKRLCLFLLSLVSTTSLVNAGWFKFGAETVLSENQQRALFEQVTQEFLQGLAVLAEGLTYHTQIQESCRVKLKETLKANSDKDQTVVLANFWKQVFSRALFEPKRKVLDKKYATDLTEGRKYEFQTPNKYFLNAIIAANSGLEVIGDGILNQILREVVRNKLSDQQWSQEQINEAFEGLWNLFSDSNLDIGGKKSPEEIIHAIESLQQDQQITTEMITGFLKTPGSIVDKTATFLANTLAAQLETQQTQKCSCDCGCFSWLSSCCTPECMKKTGDISLSVLKTAVELTPSILKIVALILSATAV